MKYLIHMLALATLLHSSLGYTKTTTSIDDNLIAGQYKCPTFKSGEKSLTVEDAYNVISAGTIWGDFGDETTMVFVDKNDVGAEANKADYTDWRGVFKIGYDHTAKECRRQIVLNPISDTDEGVYSGWMAVEVCDPKLDGLRLDQIPPLKILPEHGNEIEYIKKSDGTLSRRFKAKIDAIMFEDDQENKICRMHVIMGSQINGYADINPNYRWDYSYEKKYKAKLWRFDENKKSILIDEQLIGK